MIATDLVSIIIKKIAADRDRRASAAGLLSYKIFSSGTQPRPVSVAQAWFFHLKVSLHSSFEKSGPNQKSPEGQGQYDFAQTETSESM